jgi:hypothetical protein
MGFLFAVRQFPADSQLIPLAATVCADAVAGLLAKDRSIGP